MTDETQTTLKELIATRKEKLDKFLELGINPYGYQYEVTHHAREILEDYETYAETTEVSLAGRIMSIRSMGKASFAHIQDSTGRIQIYVKLDAIGEKHYQAFTSSWISATGLASPGK